MKRTAFSSHNELYVQYLKSENKHNMSVQHYHDTYKYICSYRAKGTCFMTTPVTRWNVAI